MMEAGEALLYVLSANGALPWQRLKEVVEELRQGRVASESAKILRSKAAYAIDSLGHGEFSEREGVLTLSVCRPTLIRLPTKQISTVVAGARSQKSLARWSEEARKLNMEMIVDSQPGELGFFYPQRLIFRSSDLDCHKRLAILNEAQFNPQPASWLIGNASCALGDAVDSWQWKPMAELNWPRHSFDPVRCYFWGKGDDSDVQLTRYEDVTRGGFLFRVRSGPLCADVTPEWGRFWLFAKIGHRVVDYDESTFTFSHPRTVPLPKLIARALVLCSGQMPTVRSYPTDGDGGRSLRLIYPGIPKKIALLLARKLGQDFTHN
jgi:hypothetical protein